MKAVQTKPAKSASSYGDDQDPSFPDGGEEYARSYHSLQQSRKLAETASPKVQPHSKLTSDIPQKSNMKLLAKEHNPTTIL